MLLMSSIFILLSSAVTFRRDKAISFNRITIIVLLYSSILGYETLFLLPLHSGTSIYDGVYQVSSLTQTFLVFITKSPDCLSTLITCFVAIITKISIFIFILDLVHYPDGLKSEFTWTISSLLSLIVGTVVGLVQYIIKRLFTYSTINRVGFILLALAINSIESIQAFIFYIIQYLLSNLNFFFLLISFGYFLSYNNEKKLSF